MSAFKRTLSFLRFNFCHFKVIDIGEQVFILRFTYLPSSFAIMLIFMMHFHLSSQGLAKFVLYNYLLEHGEKIHFDKKHVDNVANLHDGTSLLHYEKEKHFV